jgi:hypothetical protein
VEAIKTAGLCPQDVHESVRGRGVDRVVVEVGVSASSQFLMSRILALISSALIMVGWSEYPSLWASSLWLEDPTDEMGLDDIFGIKCR